MKYKHAFIIVLAISVLMFVLGRGILFRWAISAMQSAKGRKTVEERITEYGPAVRSRLAGDFARVAVIYPPHRLLLAAFKQERQLEVWVAGQNETLRLLRSYPVIAASGVLGPKLREGDRQVPEGFYRVESLNPNSLYHLSLRIDYPNQEDRAHAKLDGRTQLGGDIMIHGSDSSVGCLAMGDEAAEDLFVLAAETGIENVSILISPVDFRLRDLPADLPPGPVWRDELYTRIRAANHQLTEP